MKKSVLAILVCTLGVVLAGCGTEKNGVAVSSDINESEQIVETKISDEQDVSEIKEPSPEVSEMSDGDMPGDEEIKVIWSGVYGWEMGGDYVYIDAYGRIYEERECEEPMFEPVGACAETYTGKQFTEDELNEFFSLKKDDDDGHKELLSRKGIKFGWKN
jgi:hypothetical protein